MRGRAFLKNIENHWLQQLSGGPPECGNTPSSKIIENHWLQHGFRRPPRMRGRAFLGNIENYWLQQLSGDTPQCTMPYEPRRKRPKSTGKACPSASAAAGESPGAKTPYKHCRLLRIFRIHGLTKRAASKTTQKHGESLSFYIACGRGDSGCENSL